MPPPPPPSEDENASFLRKLGHILFGWIDDIVQWLKEIQEQADTPIDVPFSPGLDEPGEDLLPLCFIPFGLQYGNSERLYGSLMPELGEQPDYVAKYIAYIWTNYQLPNIREGVVMEEAKGTPPIEISEGVFVSAQPVQLTENRWERTMFVETDNEIRLYIAAQSSSGEWEPGELISRIEKMGDVCE